MEAVGAILLVVREPQFPQWAVVVSLIGCLNFKKLEIEVLGLWIEITGLTRDQAWDTILRLNYPLMLAVA
jgi:hypothetical protein